VQEWVRMPSDWIYQKGLTEIRWRGNDKSDGIAALMIYIIIVHDANAEILRHRNELGLSELTYSDLGDIAGISRSKVSGGLKVLVKMGLIRNIATGKRNIYRIENYSLETGWAKLPAKALYGKGYDRIKVFDHLNLRSDNELNALKLYLLIATFRSNTDNYARASYETIEVYTGIHRNKIRAAISLLVNLKLIHVDSVPTGLNQYSTSNLYRLRYIDSNNHRGTATRSKENLNYGY